MIINCNAGFGYCPCSCHRNKNVKHVMPCCVQCPHCHRNITRGWLEGHKDECLARPKVVTSDEVVSLVKNIRE